MTTFRTNASFLPMLDLLPRLTLILRNRHEKVQENLVAGNIQWDLLGSTICIWQAMPETSEFIRERPQA
jgi:hypothetical protein